MSLTNRALRMSFTRRNMRSFSCGYGARSAFSSAGCRAGLVPAGAGLVSERPCARAWLPSYRYQLLAKSGPVMHAALACAYYDIIIPTEKAHQQLSLHSAHVLAAVYNPNTGFELPLSCMQRTSMNCVLWNRTHVTTPVSCVTYNMSFQRLRGRTSHTRFDYSVAGA
jgi:hypothetical protein